MRVAFDRAPRDWTSLYHSKIQALFDLIDHPVDFLSDEQLAEDSRIDLVVRGQFGQRLNTRLTRDVPHVCVSGEAYPVGHELGATDAPADALHLASNRDGRDRARRKWYIPEENFIYTPQIMNLNKIGASNMQSSRERSPRSDKREHNLAYCASNQVPEREAVYDLFVSGFKSGVHALGGCHGSHPHTSRRCPGTHNSDQLRDMLGEYKFMWCSENDTVPGYITEKIALAWMSGCVPVYRGTDEIKHMFNEQAMVFVDDFENIQQCVDHVVCMTTQQIRVMQQQPLYNWLGPPVELDVQRWAGANQKKFKSWWEKNL